jgi:hypothetical protein
MLGILVVNPARYHEAYQGAFRTSSPLWKPEKSLTPTELQAAKDRPIDKYLAR